MRLALGAALAPLSTPPGPPAPQPEPPDTKPVHW
jgi:hypothetical protein